MQPTGPDTSGTNDLSTAIPLPSDRRGGDPRPSIDALLEAPDPNPTGATLTVDRSFAFVDICGFTAYCERLGEQPALRTRLHHQHLGARTGGDGRQLEPHRTRAENYHPLTVVDPALVVYGMQAVGQGLHEDCALQRQIALRATE